MFMRIKFVVSIGLNAMQFSGSISMYDKQSKHFGIQNIDSS